MVGFAPAGLHVAIFQDTEGQQSRALASLLEGDESITWSHQDISNVHGWEADVLLVPGGWERIRDDETKSENMERLQALGVGLFKIVLDDGASGESASIWLTSEGSALADLSGGYQAPLPANTPEPGDDAVVLLEADAPSGSVPVATARESVRGRSMTLYSADDLLPHGPAILAGLKWVGGVDRSGEGTSTYQTHRDQAILDMMEEYRDGGDHWPLDHVRHLARLAADDGDHLQRAEFLLERSFHATEEAPKARIFLLDTMAELGSPAHTDVAAHNILHDIYGESARALLVSIGSQRSREILFDAYLRLPNERREPIIRAMGEVRATNSLLSIGDMLVNGDPALAPAIMEAMLEMDTRVSLRILQNADLPDDLGEKREKMYIQRASRHVEEENHGSAATLYNFLRRSSAPGARTTGFKGLLHLPDSNHPELVAGAIDDEVLHDTAMNALHNFSEEERDAFVSHVRGLDEEKRDSIKEALGKSTSNVVQGIITRLSVVEVDVN
ncbi:MAG: hypothetical protein JJU11_07105 [Candidatus Sumerlaeia bacterium]|nr:hypothetical protein [Candidatus Sumerlaeia bacterium]